MWCAVCYSFLNLKRYLITRTFIIIFRTRKHDLVPMIPGLRNHSGVPVNHHHALNAQSLRI